MSTQKWLKVTSVQAIVFTVLVLPAFAQIPEGVSPGSSDRVAEIEGRCPSFSWGVVPGAERYQLVGYRIPEGMDPADLDPSQAEQVLYTEVPGSATSWTPDLEQCLTPGESFVWFVRAVLKEEDGEVVEASEWSGGRYFLISSRPSVREVEEALRVLERYSVAEGDSGAAAAEPQRLETGQPRKQPPSFPNLTSKSVTTAKTAIRAGVPDASGENYGIVGLSNSPNGAGLAGANTNNGPDLVLDGSEDSGDPDAVFTQAGIDRASSLDTWFFLLNSDTGKLNLNVEGSIVADGSGLTSVNAATLETHTASYFATAANHTTLDGRVTALEGNVTPLEKVIKDVALVDNAGTDEIPADYNVGDTGSLKIEHLPNLVAKLGGTTQALVTANVMRLTIEVEAYAENTMATFSGPCWTAPGALGETTGKAHWALDFKNADGSSYSGVDWKLLKVTTYLK